MHVMQPPPFEFKGIGALLKAQQLKIPLNQREYSWGDKQIDELFQDFRSAITNNLPSYFLGTIVVSKGTEDIPVVVDGQQRLATTTILLAAIRDYYFHKNQERAQTSIESQFLCEYDLEQETVVPKLTLNMDDNEYFKNRIIALPNRPERQNIEEKKESHRRINIAAQKAETLVQDIIRGLNDENIKHTLIAWSKFIENKATIILLTVPDEVSAFTMFETLNDRGLKTSQADLVKNYLFSEAGTRVNEAQSKWSKMTNILETAWAEDMVMTYLRHLAITLFGPTREKEIFEKIKKEVRGKTNTLSFLEKISDYADTYVAIVTPTHPRWSGLSTKIPTAINIMRELKVRQIQPLMLAVAQHFEPKELEKAFRSFVSWTVRFLIAGGMRGGALEDAYGEKAHDVYLGEIKTTNELLNALSNIIPRDGEFKLAFETARVSRHSLARYYLRAMERQLRKDQEPELVPSEDTSFLNLEHILPREKGSNWSHIDVETFESYHKRIGNMTLLNTKVNSTFGNSNFQSKRVEFKKSPLLITKGIYDMTNHETLWDAKDINERQNQLAKIAMKTWALVPK